MTMATATATKPDRTAKLNARRQQPARSRRTSAKSGASAAEHRVRQIAGLGAKPSGGIEVAMVRRLSGLSQAEFARVSGYSTRAIAGWEAGGTLAGAARRRMIELRRL